ncbi:TIR domain-containing protein [Micromonospora sp. NPDC049836]|uniref:TIR domain-containing protein n=1 Tax=Micromonospora sp. NPDC049836 TaxID=3364274 RepID=UPI003789F233
MVIRNVFGDTSKYLTDLAKISFSPRIYPASEDYIRSSWSSGVNQLRNLLNTMAEEVQLFGTDEGSDTTETQPQVEAKAATVFLVHGHDDRVKAEVARFLEQLGLEVVILHERVNAGRTIIEKFEHESSGVEFAVVLLTADDVGSTKAKPDELLPRARQNVVFELGYFIGTLGRSKVAALIDSSVETPSDYSGVVYIPLDAGDSWKLQLAREVKSSGIDIDLNKALG